MIVEKKSIKSNLYSVFLKRLFDIIFALTFIIFFSWLYLIIALIVAIKLGSPVIFVQPRPGKLNEKTNEEVIFSMYKFRTMTNEKDSKGDLLPDEMRLTTFGKWLRKTSLDELPEMFNLLNGTMSLIGPRPQLVRDMVFMTSEQRLRHIVRPGLTGLAQINGRNAISWEEKLNWDLIYIQNINLLNDVKIFLKTFSKVLKRSDIIRPGTESDLDYGDYLLLKNKITKKEYDDLQEKSYKKLEKFRNEN